MAQIAIQTFCERQMTWYTGQVVMVVVVVKQEIVSIYFGGLVSLDLSGSSGLLLKMLPCKKVESFWKYLRSTLVKGGIDFYICQTFKTMSFSQFPYFKNRKYGCYLNKVPLVVLTFGIGGGLRFLSLIYTSVGARSTGEIAVLWQF